MPSTRTIRLGSLLSALNRELQQSDYCFCSSKRKKKKQTKTAEIGWKVSFGFLKAGI